MFYADGKTAAGTAVIILQLDSAFALGIAALYFETKREHALIESGEYDPRPPPGAPSCSCIAVGLLLFAYGRAASSRRSP